LKSQLASCQELIGKYENKKKRDLENLKKHNEKILAIQQEHEEEKLGLTHTIHSLKAQIQELELQGQNSAPDSSLIVLTSEGQERVIKQQQDEINELKEKINQLMTRSLAIDQPEVGGERTPSPVSMGNESRSSSEGDNSFVVLESNRQKKRLEAEENLMKLEALSNERIQLLENKLHLSDKEKETLVGELRAVTMSIQAKDEFISELQEERQRLESENNQLLERLKANRASSSSGNKHVIKNMEKVAQTPPSSARQVGGLRLTFL
jgi:chromosome segregation ATPase